MAGITYEKFKEDSGKTFLVLLGIYLPRWLGFIIRA